MNWPSTRANSPALASRAGCNGIAVASKALASATCGLFAGRKIDVPALFIAGAADWGAFQAPGAFAALGTRACSRFRGAHRVEGAGHWVQQEQPEAVVELLLNFLEG